MATFRIGQRVKLVRSANGARSPFYGATGTFAGYESHARGEHVGPGYTPLSFDCDCRVVWDQYSSEALYQHTQQLEPATDCYDKADWRECAWKPPHLREVAA